MKTIYHPLYVSIIEQLIEVRKNQAMTQQQLADRLGRLQSYVAKVEVCERKMDLLEFIEWCNALGETASEYVREAEKEKRDKNLTASPFL